MAGSHMLLMERKNLYGLWKHHGHVLERAKIHKVLLKVVCTLKFSPNV
jgi:hypothetical protein